MTTVGKPFDFIDFIRHLALPALESWASLHGHLPAQHASIDCWKSSTPTIVHDGHQRWACPIGSCCPARLPQHDPQPDHHGHRPVDPADSVGAAVVTETVFACPDLVR
jgi:hypothetical protein